MVFLWLYHYPSLNGYTPYLLNGYPIYLVPKTSPSNDPNDPSWPALATAAAKATGDAPAIGAIKTCPEATKLRMLHGIQWDLMGFNGI